MSFRRTDPSDAGPDARVDGATDGAIDGATDGATDGAVDVDLGPDASLDLGPDAALDLGSDLGIDLVETLRRARLDRMADNGTDVLADAFLARWDLDGDGVVEMSELPLPAWMWRRVGAK